MSKTQVDTKEITDKETSILDFNKVIRNNLKRFRKERGMNQAEFARVLDMDAKYLSHLERGDYCWSCKRLIEAMEKLEVTPNQVFPSYLSVNTSDAKLDKVLTCYFALDQDSQNKLVTLFEMQVQMMEREKN